MGVVENVDNPTAVVSPLQGVVKPSSDSFKRQITEINTKVTEIQTELMDIQNKLQIVLESGNNSRGTERRAEIRSELEATNDKLQVEENSQRAITDRIQDLQRASLQKSQEITRCRAELEFQSIDELKEKITKLQTKLQTSNLPLKDEKKVIRDISLLTQKVPSIKLALKQVQLLESRQPDNSTAISTGQTELTELRETADKLRKQKRLLQTELRSINESDQEARSTRSSEISDLIAKRIELEDERDKQTSILLDAESDFNKELNNYRTYETQKKKAQKQKELEKKRLERFEFEHDALQREIDGCVSGDNDAEDGPSPNNHVLQLFDFCHIELERLRKEEEQREMNKSQIKKVQPKKQGLDINLIGEFGEYGLRPPQTPEQFENAIEVLKPLHDSQCEAKNLMMKAMDEKRAKLQAKLDALAVQMSSPKSTTTLKEVDGGH
eukprot:GHVH01004295.1.p1 GENE.GHVH01004295.1~~GHVH01004295.1.p1  ORF type:complete len:468 (+),score=92.85 GHVH01004295.1:84-1406(+)